MISHASSDSVIDFDLVIPSLIASSHKQLIRLCAHEAARAVGVSERILAERLAENEKEHPYAIGGGVAIANLKLSGLSESVNIFIRLRHAVPMDAPDNEDVDLVCLLLSPEREGAAYLRTMARISRLLRDESVCRRLRAAATEKEIHQIFGRTAALLKAA